MASVTAAQLLVRFLGDVTPGSPRSGGPIQGNLNNGADGHRWIDGTASGAVNRIYRGDGTLGSGGTDSYNVLTAGALVDIDKRAINLSKLKALVLVVTSGSIAFKAPAADFLACFGATGDLFDLSMGSLRCIALDFGDAGLTIDTSGKFDIVERASAAATYSLAFAGVN